MSWKTLSQMDLKGKRVLTRVDLNVPIIDGKVSDATRIEKIVPTLNEIIKKGGTPILLSHMGRPKGERNPNLSLSQLQEKLENYFKSRVVFVADCIGPSAETALKVAEKGQIILLENILNLGKIGDKVTVKNGYGRNYLLKQGKALRFSKDNQEIFNKKKDELNKKNLEIKNKFKETANTINNKTFTFIRESKENGELYGSIKPKEITNLIKEKIKLEIGPSQIVLKDEINKIGIFKVDINFHSEVKAIISIKVSKIQSK